MEEGWEEMAPRIPKVQKDRDKAKALRLYWAGFAIGLIMTVGAMVLDGAIVRTFWIVIWVLVAMVVEAGLGGHTMVQLMRRGRQ